MTGPPESNQDCGGKGTSTSWSVSKLKEEPSSSTATIVPRISLIISSREWLGLRNIG